MKKNKKTINANIAIAVINFFFFVFLSGVIIRFYLLRKRTNIKNRYKIEYPNIDFAFFELNLFFLNCKVQNINNYNIRVKINDGIKNTQPNKINSVR